MQEHRPVESAAEERLWDALYLARAGKTGASTADLEDSVFRMYLPMARSLAHATIAESSADRPRAEEQAELGLAHAVLGWRQRTGGGFRHYARTAILRRLSGDTEYRSPAAPDPR